MTRPAPSSRLDSVNGIGIREASKKYNIPDRTISRWVSAGLIRWIHRPERRGQAGLIMEEDLIAILPQYDGKAGRGKLPSLEHVRRAG